MPFPRRIHRLWPVCLLLLLLGHPATTRAYVDMAPTLARLLRDAQTITLVEVDKSNFDKGAVILRKIRDLKGSTPADPIRHQVTSPKDHAIPRHILEWAEPGRRGILLVSDKTALICTGHAWYQVQSGAEGWWTLGPERPDLPLAYYGSITRLTQAIPPMLDGKSAIITTIPHGADNEGASFDLALNRANLPGLVKTQRLRANLRMPAVVLSASANPAYFVGLGQAGEDEIPSLIKLLQSTDATARAESADDLGSLGPAAAAAVAPLTALLDDPLPLVRMSAASALLRIAPKDPRPTKALADAFKSPDPAIRRHAARAAGLAGPAAAPLAPGLAALLDDADNLTRLAALQAIATLGPAAASATDAVARLLDNPQAAADAADALGRIGPAARPAMQRIAPLLSANAISTRWAAVRAMSQIGGPDAAPAVEFMIAELAKRSEVDCYNMMIYLGLLGPVAKDAIPAIQRTRIRNPVLGQAAIWAIQPEKNLPWQATGRIGMPMMVNANYANYIFESFIQESDHLGPGARLLAEKIMDGTAGMMPQWGYKLLARFPDQTIPLLTPHLASDDLATRERATVTLGYMGSAAAPASEQVRQALSKAANEQEQRLIQWCLREIAAKQ